MSGIKVIFGGAGVNPGNDFGTVEALKTAYDVLEKGNVGNIDTATLYGESERLFGESGAGQRFTVDTKTRGGFNENGGSRDNILAESKQSKDRLRTTVDIYYIHAPDASTDLQETCAAINEVHKSGFFKRFGLSNYKAADVEKVYDICKEKGYVLPSVYQGNYSAIARLQETMLFPTLRKLNMSFYAYSPLAGGFLSKNKEEVTKGAGRFNDSDNPLARIYTEMYRKPSFVEALTEWESIAKDEKTTKADLAYRWVRFNSPLKLEQGDAIIIGARNLQQLQETLDSINGGPVSDSAVKRIDALWEQIAKDAPLDNFHGHEKS